jgi:hypothetical protein
MYASADIATGVAFPPMKPLLMDVLYNGLAAFAVIGLPVKTPLKYASSVRLLPMVFVVMTKCLHVPGFVIDAAFMVWGYVR